MKLLALDTSSEGCSAALWLDGRVTERFEVAPRGHTRLLMPMEKKKTKPPNENNNRKLKER